MLLWLLQLALGTPGVSIAPSYRAGAHEYAASIRQNIIVNRSHDHTVPPASTRSVNYSAFSETGTDVQIQIRLFKVHTVNIAQSTMKLKVWVRMKWMDERLTWTPEDFGGVKSIMLESRYNNHAEVWLPDIAAYNANTGFASSLEPADLKVSSDGMVFWSRPGYLDVMCRFTGLIMFPFDEPACAIELGGWMLSGTLQGITFFSSGAYEFSAQELTQGSSYQEYSIKHVSAEINNYEYIEAGGGDIWPVVTYHITLNRSSLFYVILVCVPSCLVTLLSFIVRQLASILRPLARPMPDPCYTRFANCAHPEVVRIDTTLHRCFGLRQRCAPASRTPHRTHA